MVRDMARSLRKGGDVMEKDKAHKSDSVKHKLPGKEVSRMVSKK